MRPGVIIAAALCACARPPLQAELPPSSGPGDRVVVVTSPRGTTAFYLDDDATLPTFRIDDPDRLRIRVIDLGATRAQLNASAESPTERPTGPARSLVGFRSAQERWVDADTDSAWTPLPALDEDAARIRLPIDSPCFSLELAQHFDVGSDKGMRLLRQTDDEILIESRTEWYRAHAADRRVEPIPSPVEGLSIIHSVAVPGGGAWAVGLRDPTHLELWRQDAPRGPFARVHTATLATAVLDEPFRISAVSTRAAFWLTRRGHVARIEPGASPLEYVPSVEAGPRVNGSLAALSDEEAVAILPFGFDDPRDRYVAEVSRRVDRLEAVTTTVSAALAYSVGRDAVSGAIWVGGAGGDALTLTELKRAPRDAPPAASVASTVGPATYGPWRGLVFHGTSGLLTYRWAGFTGTLDLTGFGDCRVGASGLNVGAIVPQTGGLWVVGAGKDDPRTRLLWSALP